MSSTLLACRKSGMGSDFGLLPPEPALITPMDLVFNDLVSLLDGDSISSDVPDSGTVRAATWRARARDGTGGV